MKSLLTSALTAAVCATSAVAGELPAIFEKPFLGCFVGFEEARDFDFALGSDGTSELFFKKGRNRLATHGTSMKFYYVLEERPAGKPTAKWVNRTMQDDGFETSHKETVEPELDKPITFTATYTGDTKAEISHTFTKKGVYITTRIAEKTTKNDVRVGVRILVGDLYRHIKEELTERELKSKIKRSEVQVWPVGARSSAGKKVKLYENIILQEEFNQGAKKFAVESDRLGDHEIIFSTENEDLGTIIFKQTRDLYHGFYATWYPDPAKVDDKECRLFIEVK